MSAKTRQSASAQAAGDETTRERILGAALKVFAMRGFDGARTREIADLAGANLGLIKYYFDSKEKLWKEAVAGAFGELQQELAGALSMPVGSDARAQLEQIVRRFVHFVARNPAFVQLMNDEGKRNDRRMRWLADRFVRPLFQVMRERVEAAQAGGLLPPVSPVSLHYIVLGATSLVFSESAECRYVTGVDPATEEFAQSHAEAVLRLLLATPRRRAGSQARTTRKKARGGRTSAR